MDAKTISIFVDESGSFIYPDEMSPYYLIGLVLHDQDKVYYDRGQAEVNAMLKEPFATKFGGKVEFVPDVKPEKYKLFQLADLICTVSLITRKIELGYPMTNSEHKFFGGPRVFTRNILRSIKLREIRRQHEHRRNPSEALVNRFTTQFRGIWLSRHVGIDIRALNRL